MVPHRTRRRTVKDRKLVDWQITTLIGLKMSCSHSLPRSTGSAQSATSLVSWAHLLGGSYHSMPAGQEAMYTENVHACRLLFGGMGIGLSRTCSRANRCRLRTYPFTWTRVINQRPMVTTSCKHLQFATSWSSWGSRPSTPFFPETPTMKRVGGKGYTYRFLNCGDSKRHGPSCLPSSSVFGARRHCSPHATSCMASQRWHVAWGATTMRYDFLVLHISIVCLGLDKGFIYARMIASYKLYLRHIIL